MLDIFVNLLSFTNVIDLRIFSFMH